MPDNPYSKFYSYFDFFHPQMTESWGLYATQMLKTFAESLIGIFIPIYIFTVENKPIIHKTEIINGIIWVLIFYMIRSIFVFLLNTFFTNVVFGKIRFKIS